MKSDIIEDKKVLQTTNSKEIGGEVEVGCHLEQPQDVGEGLSSKNESEFSKSFGQNHEFNIDQINSDHESRGD